MIRYNLPNGETIVDDEYADILKQYSWRINENGYVCGQRRVGKKGKHNGIKRASTKQYRLHRVILNAPIGVDVDHINGIRTDNRLCNLRLCSRGQNLCNTRVRSDSKTGFKGVSFYKSRNKYEAYIDTNYKRKKLGYFNKAEDAAKAYDSAAILIHGSFAKTNFPQVDLQIVRAR